ncbi:MAG: polyprenyl synthetase family protein [Polyangiaceae bacterium]|nr:polyprenyl synthetase family protein [Polyangiaceae bacterium]
MSPNLDDIDRSLASCRAALIEGGGGGPAGDLLSMFLGRGKMIRARLCLLSAGAAGGHPRFAESGALAIELLHAASLLHDDIVDRALQRRGLTTLNAALGNDVAMITGDILIGRAVEALVRSPEIEPASIRPAVSILARAIQDWCRGQLLEIDGSSPVSSVSEYFDMVAGKTGSLFAAACALGGVLGGGAPHVVDALSVFGGQLGEAFQLADDASEVYGNPKELGRSVGCAVSQHRPLYPIVVLLEEGSADARAALARLLEEAAPLDAVRRMLQEHGALDRLRQARRAAVQRARQALATLPPSGFVPMLDALAESCPDPTDAG